MAKMEELRRQWKEHIPKESLEKGDTLTFILIDEENKLYIKRTSTITHQRTVEKAFHIFSPVFLPNGVRDFIDKNGGQFNDPRYSVIVKRKIMAAELKLALPGYRKFVDVQRANSMNYREKNNLKSNVFKNVHKPTGVTVFVSRLQTEHREYNAWVVQTGRTILNKRFQNRDKYCLGLYNKFVHTSSEKDWEIELVKVVDATDTRQLITLLNDSLVAQNVDILLDLEIEEKLG